MRPRPHRLLPILLVSAAALASALTASGCGGTARGAKPADVVAITERDFHISAPTHLKAGEIDLRVHNKGPDQHEFIIVPTNGKPLPLRKDGLTVDEEAIESEEPGSLEPGQPGTVRNLDVDLKPGRYIFFCNMEGHYMGGMHTEVVVTQ